jgi:pathogenesis-related protein 1
MKLALIFALLLGFGLTVLGQKVPKKTGSKASQEEAQAALDFHNKVRREVGTPPLEWSAKVAAYAQAWANNLAKSGCKMEHRPNDGKWKRIYGENLFLGSGQEYTLTSASESWYSEIKDYKGEKLNNSNFHAVGHYTQMVWRNTKSVGMARAECPNGEIIIVASYDPTGNYLGEKAY